MNVPFDLGLQPPRYVRCIVVCVDWQVWLCRDVTRVNTAVVLWESMWSPVSLFFSRVFYDVGTDSRIVCRRLYSWPSDECKQCFTVVPSSGSPSSWALNCITTRSPLHNERATPSHYFTTHNLLLWRGWGCVEGLPHQGVQEKFFNFPLKHLFVCTFLI